MGDRVSIAFRNTGWNNQPLDSVTLFNHWGGKGFPRIALNYAKKLKAEMETKPTNVITPLKRLEPYVVMVDFIRYLWQHGEAQGKEYNDEMEYVKTGRINDSIYLGKDSSDGDNSDNGHYIVDLRTMTLERC